MMPVTHILVPVDFSEHSQRALDSAKTLAEKFGASIHLLTVVPDPFVLPDPSSWYVPVPPEYVDGLRRDAEDHLRGLLTPDERNRFRAHSAMLFGNASASILEYIERESIDLVVMGTHGRGGIARAVMGSVAEKVVRSAPCPVLTVR
jgi:nucleotide-binding universal stress UspA family protein